MTCDWSTKNHLIIYLNSKNNIPFHFSTQKQWSTIIANVGFVSLIYSKSKRGQPLLDTNANLVTQTLTTGQPQDTDGQLQLKHILHV